MHAPPRKFVFAEGDGYKFLHATPASDPGDIRLHWDMDADTRVCRSGGPGQTQGGSVPTGRKCSREHEGTGAVFFCAKLDRQGTYEPIDGPTMAELAGDKTISLATTVDALKGLAAEQKPIIYIWGELNETGAKQTLAVNLLDLREKEAKPHQVSKTISDPTEYRFAVEQVLETIKGIDAFEHPLEISVWDDARSKELWAKNPNLVPNPHFAQNGAEWTVLYMAEKYAATVSDRLPDVDKVCILSLPREAGQEPRNVLAMNLSKDCAENNGLACLSDFIKIEPNTRYRLQFKYKSDGPILHVFVKGYTSGPSAVDKETVKREVYKRQVPPSGGTDGKWVTVIDDMNPQNPARPVQFLRVDLYAYLKPGVVMFEDVQLKAVGPIMHHAKDDAIKIAPKN